MAGMTTRLPHDKRHALNPPHQPARTRHPPGYSQIVDVSAGRIIFIAGQTALDRDGNVVGKMILPRRRSRRFGTSRSRCRRADARPANLVKLTVFLTDMDNLGRYREARNRFFATVTPPAAPAVTLVEVSKLYGPDFLIEIEAIAAA